VNAIRRSAIVPYSDHEMYVLVADIEAYPKFLPWCGGARVLNRQDDTVEAAVTIAYRGVDKTFTTRNLLRSDKLINIRLVEGPFRHLHGDWRFTALGAQACKIELDLEFEVANRLLSVVMTPVFSAIAGQLVEAFQGRALALYGKR
jgi:ribosome-associated toxin RatA of RatAB toxin-antitoxin module